MTDDRDWVESLVIAVADECPLDGVYVCRDAPGALRLGSHHDPDVVIVDTRFGDAVAAEVIRELRRELTPSLYLLLTGEEGALARRQALAVGARDYLSRELTSAQLNRFVGHLGMLATRTVRTRLATSEFAMTKVVAASD